LNAALKRSKGMPHSKRFKAVFAAAAAKTWQIYYFWRSNKI
jgi:hypothetical protein